MSHGEKNEELMNIARPKLLSHGNSDSGVIPRDYNFAADILERNLDVGRTAKLAYIDRRRGWTYGELAERVERFGHMLRLLGLRLEERVFLCLLDTIDW